MKKITNYKKSCPRITRINTNFQKKETNITKTKGSHGLHQNQKLLRGVQGGGFLEKSPPMLHGAEGKKEIR